MVDHPFFVSAKIARLFSHPIGRLYYYLFRKVFWLRMDLQVQ